MRSFFILLIAVVSFLPAYCQEEYSTYTSSASDYISAYQKYLSPYKNGNCSHYPHCSNYAMMVFEDRPFFDALCLTSERLIRCGYDRSMYEITLASGKQSVLDYPPYLPYPFQLAYRDKIYPHVDIKKEKSPTPMGFVDMLINQADFESAQLEMNRLIYYKIIEPSAAFTRQLKCYIGLNQIERGIYFYEKTIQPFLEKYPDTQLQAAILYYKTEMYDKTLAALSEEETGVLCDSNYCSTFNALRGVTSFALGQIDNTKDYFDQAYLYNPQAQYQYKNNSIILQKWNSFEPKSPSVATMLSIIPGLGYWYTGHKGSAISAFLFDAVLGYAAYTSFSKKNYGVGILFGVLSTTFYIGNIKGSGSSAVRYNTIHKKQIQEELENNNNIYIVY